MYQSNEYLDQTIQLSKQLLYCAEFGDHEREDESCGDFYRIVRESADKILTAAEQERLYHLDRETGKPEKTNRIIARKVAAVRAFCKMYLS